MTYALTWLPKVLRDAGLNVAEQSGWKTRGHGNMGAVKGVMCHHTVGPLTGNMPSLNVITKGRLGLSGPLAQIGLGRDGTCYVIAAGRAYHAGSGNWQGYTHGNSNFIGIEAENTGYDRGPKADPWPEVQLDAYQRCAAAILKKIRADAIMCCGHKEYRLPPGTKVDPLFDMNDFRFKVAAIMAGQAPRISKIPSKDGDGRPTLQRGSAGLHVRDLQAILGLTVDGSFNGATEAAVRQFQRDHGLRPDGIVGPRSWATLLAA